MQSTYIKILLITHHDPAYKALGLPVTSTIRTGTVYCRSFPCCTLPFITCCISTDSFVPSDLSLQVN